MATVSFLAEYAVPIPGSGVQPTARAISRRTTMWSWRAVGDTASGLVFLGALAWTMWHLGNVLIQLVPQVAAAGGGYLF